VFSSAIVLLDEPAEKNNDGTIVETPWTYLELMYGSSDPYDKNLTFVEKTMPTSSSASTSLKKWSMKWTMPLLLFSTRPFEER
jgi:hypothetical protein